MILKVLCYILFVSNIGLIAAVQRCDYITLPHGKVKYFNRARKARFSCFKPYTLIGNPRLDCEDGEWSGEIPICASKGCSNIPNFHHGKANYFNGGALAKLECDANFTLIGSSTPNLVCEAFGLRSTPQWNYTEIPECQANSIRQFETCDYEPDNKKECKWISKPGLFNWTVLSADPKENVHLPVDNYPSHDHTLRSKSFGHFLFLENLFAPTKKWLEMLNAKTAAARYISPLFPPIAADDPHCLVFYFYSDGPHPGTVEILANEDSIWKRNNSLGTEWNKMKIPLRDRTTSFRITIEGKGTLIYPARTAIDDLRIAIGDECLDDHRAEEVVSTTQSSIETTTEYATMTTSAESFTATIIVDNLETTTTEQSNYVFTTLPPESQVASTEPDSWNAPSHFNFAANDLVVPVNRNVTNSTSNEVSEGSNPAIKIEHTKLPGHDEIRFTENDPFHHDSSAENESGNDIIVEEEGAPANLTHVHEHDNELNDFKTPAGNSTSDESIEEKQRDEKEKQAISNDLALLQNFLIPKNSTEVIDAPVTKATRSVIQSNNSKHTFGQKKFKQLIEDEKLKIRYSDEEETTSQQANDENNEVENKASHFYKTNNLISNKIIWLTSAIILCILVTLFVVQGYKKYHFGKRKDESSIRFFKSNGSSSGRHDKDDVLVLNCMPKKMT